MGKNKELTWYETGGEPTPKGQECLGMIDNMLREVQNERDKV